MVKIILTGAQFPQMDERVASGLLLFWGLGALPGVTEAHQGVKQPFLQQYLQSPSKNKKLIRGIDNLA
jgi:hypothetical protein